MQIFILHLLLVTLTQSGQMDSECILLQFHGVFQLL